MKTIRFALMRHINSQSFLRSLGSWRRLQWEQDAAHILLDALVASHVSVVLSSVFSDPSHLHKMEGTENQAEVVSHLWRFRFSSESRLCFPWDVLPLPFILTSPAFLCTANCQPTQLFTTLKISSRKGWQNHY